MPVEKLPDETLLDIAELLQLPDQTTLVAVSRRLRPIAEDHIYGSTLSCTRIRQKDYNGHFSKLSSFLRTLIQRVDLTSKVRVPNEG